MTKSFPRIVLVGTGAGANAERCHTCIAIQTGPEHTLLLDSGSGIEVVRHLKRAGIDLSSIEDVFLSHRHSDHIGGLELLMLHIGLHTLATGTHAAEMDVYGPPLVLDVARSMIDGMGSVAPQLFGQMGERLAWLPLEPERDIQVHSGVRLRPFVVDHTPPDGSCWGCVVEAVRDGRTYRVLYTGDTRPVPALLEHARGVDVLIHECGGHDVDADRVHRFGHCTAGDAGRLAQEAGCRRLVLTHIPDNSIVDALRAEAQQAFDGAVTTGADLDAFTFE